MKRRKAGVTPGAGQAPLIKSPAVEPAANRHARDAELVELCLAGERDAWGELLTRHRPLVLTIARRHGLHGEAAEDLFQATCVIMLERLELLRDHRSLAAWVATTATRKAWRLRARRADEALSPHAEDSAPSPERAFAEASEATAVREELDRIGEPCRGLLLALFDEEETYGVVARRLGLAVGSIGVYRRRCLERLEVRLRARGVEASTAEGLR